ncbi:MAG: hypothetical protein HQL18_03895, partial [Candidatus Omnitrophica bacterium]|nr:hypothetical protein [Candidatus Omnitrophota bacterium]
MHWPDKLFLKLYCFFFAWLAFGQIFALTLPQVDAFVYYHTMIAFYKPSGLQYTLALCAAILTVASLFPVILYAFNAPRNRISLLKALFLARIVGDVLGHNY